MNKTIPELLKQYHEAEKQIHECFGFKGFWRALPIDDLTNKFWFEYMDTVYWSDVPFTIESIDEGMQLYTAELYGGQGMFKKDSFTMIAADTQSDGNIFLMIFDDSKELRDQDLIDHCIECW